MCYWSTLPILVIGEFFNRNFVHRMIDPNSFVVGSTQSSTLSQTSSSMDVDTIMERAQVVLTVVDIMVQPGNSICKSLRVEGGSHNTVGKVRNQSTMRGRLLHRSSLLISRHRRSPPLQWT